MQSSTRFSKKEKKVSMRCPIQYIDPKDFEIFRVYMLLNKRFPLAHVFRDVLIALPASLIPIV